MAENTVFLTVASAVEKIAFLALAVFFTRYIGVKAYGEYLLVATLVNIFKMASTFGLNRLFVRDLAIDFSQVSKYLGNSVVILTGLSFTFYLILLATGRFLKYPPEIFYLICIAGLSIFPQALASIFGSVLQSLQLMKETAKWSCINSVIISIGSILIIQFGFGLREVFFFWTIACAVSTLGLYSALHKHEIRFSLRCDSIFILNTLKSSSPFTVLGITSVVYASMGLVILSKMGTSEAVAWYGAPFRLTEAFSIIPVSVGIALYPIASVYSVTSREVLWEKFQNTVRYMIILALPLGFAFCCLSKPIVVLLFGKDFLPSAQVLSILIWATVLLFVNAVAIPVVANSNLLHRFAWVYIFHTILCSFIYYSLIRWYGYVGASIAKLISEFLLLLILVYFLKPIFKRTPNYIRIGLRPIMAVIVAGIPLYLFPQSHFILLISIFLVAYTLIVGEVSLKKIYRIKDFCLGNKRLLNETSKPD